MKKECCVKTCCIIYIFNLDVKLIGFVYKLLGKHYDDMDRERKL